MSTLQAELGRASALARIDDIIQVLREQVDLSGAHREWLRGLLFPISSEPEVESHLIEAEDDMADSLSVLEVLLSSVRSDNDLKSFEGSVAALARLYERITKGESLEAADRTLLLETMNLLRRSLISDLPTAPRIKDNNGLKFEKVAPQ